MNKLFYFNWYELCINSIHYWCEISITTLLIISFISLHLVELFEDGKELEVAQFIQTNRGGRKLLYQGFSFTQNRKFSTGIISWKCTKYKKWKCFARAVTRIVDDIEYIKISKPTHSHPEDVECKRIKKDLSHLDYEWKYCRNKWN